MFSFRIEEGALEQAFCDAAGQGLEDCDVEQVDDETGGMKTGSPRNHETNISGLYACGECDGAEQGDGSKRHGRMQGQRAAAGKEQEERAASPRPPGPTPRPSSQTSLAAREAMSRGTKLPNAG